MIAGFQEQDIAPVCFQGGAARISVRSVLRIVAQLRIHPKLLLVLLLACPLGIAFPAPFPTPLRNLFCCATAACSAVLVVVDWAPLRPLVSSEPKLSPAAALASSPWAQVMLSWRRTSCNRGRHFLPGRFLEVHSTPRTWPGDACVQDSCGFSNPPCNLMLRCVLLLDAPAPSLYVLHRFTTN